MSIGKGIAIAAIWIATAVAVCIGFYYTKKSDCFLAFVFPSVVTGWMTLFD